MCVAQPNIWFCKPSPELGETVVSSMGRPICKFACDFNNQELSKNQTSTKYL